LFDKVLTKVQQRNKKFEMTTPDMYTQSSQELLEEKVHSDGRIVRKYTSKTEVTFVNGVRRTQFTDGF
jgi:hypothetical protein